jgi:polycystin 1L2
MEASADDRDPEVPDAPADDAGDEPQDNNVQTADSFEDPAAALLEQDASVPRKSSSSSVHQPAHLEAQDKPIITRLHVMEYLSNREWWYDGQNNLCFTVVLWLVFIYIMYVRAGVSLSYDLHLAVEQHMEHIVAHPQISGIALRTVDDMPVPCRCACQSSARGMPTGPCDPNAAEHLNFLGRLDSMAPRLPAMSNIALLAAQIDPTWLGDKLGLGNDDIEEVTYKKIVEPNQVWFWVEHGFIPNIWTPRSQDGKLTLQGLVAQKNLIIGGVRVRQERAAWAPDCDKKVSTQLDTLYGMDCRKSEDAKGYFGPSGVGSNLTAPFRPSKTEGFYDAILNVELPVGEALGIASYCRLHRWIDSATRSVDLQFISLNAEVGMFALVHIKFDFLYGGGIDRQLDVHPLQATGQTLEPIDMIPELIWAGMILLLLRQELSQLAFEAFHRRCLDYWLDLWCVVDWVSILVGASIGAFWFWQISSISEISDAIGKLERSPFASGAPTSIDEYQTQWQKILDDASSVYEKKQYYQLCLFWYTMILTGRFLKGFLSQSKLAMLQLTLGSTWWDVTHLLVFFVVIFINFMLGGHILFGQKLSEWSTLVKAGTTSIRMLLGDFAFDDMYEIYPVAATIWFWTFLLSMIFIMMNIAFAIIADYFHVFRRSIGATPTIWTDIVVALKEMRWRLVWRKEVWSDAESREEYCDACCYSPYRGVLENLMAAAQVPEGLERDSRHSCLGVKLGRRHMEAMSVEKHKHKFVEGSGGKKEEVNPGFKEATSKGIQELDCEIMAADHLLEMTQPFVEIETALYNHSTLKMMRNFVDLLRKHREELDEHCNNLEDEVYNLADGPESPDGRSGLFRYIEKLEDSLKDCLGEFDRLKATGIHSLAPHAQAMPRPGTLAAREAQEKSMLAPGALLRAVDLQTANIKRLPPQPPNVLTSNSHANAFLMDTKETKKLGHARLALKNNPMAYMSKTNTTLMVGDTDVPMDIDSETQSLLAIEAGHNARRGVRNDFPQLPNLADNVNYTLSNSYPADPSSSNGPPQDFQWAGMGNSHGSSSSNARPQAIMDNSRGARSNDVPSQAIMDRAEDNQDTTPLITDGNNGAPQPIMDRSGSGAQGGGSGDAS